MKIDRQFYFIWQIKFYERRSWSDSAFLAHQKYFSILGNRWTRQERERNIKKNASDEFLASKASSSLAYVCDNLIKNSQQLNDKNSGSGVSHLILFVYFPP